MKSPKAMTINRRPKYAQELSERVTIIEHQILGNGSIGLQEQVRELKNEVTTIKRRITAGLLVMCVLFGEKIYELIKLL